ncbi:MAG: phosphate ABC transporter substrate-binding protein [Candidatus Eremiobacteraeota bacterium]|nr:phosphate ABC transporter substrate-binding protein [Candidatus Eremiobacteraeota bacterium]
MFKKIAIAAVAASLFAPMAAMADVNLSASGSSALLPLVKESAQAYQTAHPDVKVSVSGGGSYVGISQATSKSVDIGDSDVIAPGNSGLKDHKVAVVGFGVIVNPSAGVSGLSRKQIRDIFSGKVTNWSQVGGKDGQITVINRPRASGTRAVFNATVMGASRISEAGLVEDSSGTVVNTVGSTPGSISYVALGYTRGKPVNILKVDNIAPTEENIERGKYAIWSYEHMFTHAGSPSQAEDFIRFVMNNKDTITKLGYILVSEMKVHENNR